MRIIVSGGRAFSDKTRVDVALDSVHSRSPVTVVVHGGCSGADSLAGEWAAANGVTTEVHLADWAAFGRSAGPRRNAIMVASGASLVVAFPGGAGTAGLVRMARAAGIEVVEA